MRTKRVFHFFLSISILMSYNLFGQQHQTENFVKLSNPVDVKYLKSHIRKGGKRLVLTPALEKKLKQKLKSDTVVQNIYRAISLNANDIMTQPLLVRKVIGRRLLSTSRELLFRMNVLSMVYVVERDAEVLQRVNDELVAVCNFIDWNPSHYLDVAEMSVGVALAVDWMGEVLPASTVRLAKEALVKKGIEPSYGGDWTTDWVQRNSNWNQVCHAGMVAASIVMADEYPELAAKTISRALDGIPYALKEYGPDGVYPEGSTYWDYGTTFSAITSSMLESAFGTDFGLADYPAFKESADFRLHSIAPSGLYYNFADCGDKRDENGDFLLAWFASKTDNAIYFEKDRFLRNPSAMGKLDRLAGLGLLWVVQFDGAPAKKISSAWKGEGSNPVIFFRGESESSQYYLGAKGGRGSVNHGNMDAGSFVFELFGVRWSVDPGNQNYHELEKTGFNLWGTCQECDRWTLLTKNNFGHSTISINDKLHVADGFARVADFKAGANPEATIEMSAVFGNDIAYFARRFAKEGETALLIEDVFKLNDSTDQITWQLITTAEVQIVKGGAVLLQGGKQLKLDILSHPRVSFSVISLDPPPLKLDRQIENLKRVEIRLPAYLFPEKEGKLIVRLSGV